MAHTTSLITAAVPAFSVPSVDSPAFSLPAFSFRGVDFVWHPEVWLLIGFLTGAYIYMVRVIGPNAVPAGAPAISRMNLWSFVGAMVLLWIASDWPLHDISEDYLYSAHMFQHMVLSYFVPPLALMATPTWLARALLGDGRLYRTVRWFAKPVVAAVIFNGIVIMLHLPWLVNTSIDNAAFHYSLHVVVVASSLLMWTPVCGPIPEFRMGAAGSMIYLFLQSVVPTVPAGFLTFADDAIYEAYNRPVRLWGLSLAEDQQLAGAIMKTAGGFFLWGLIIYIFFRRFAVDQADAYDFTRRSEIPDAEIVGNDETPLTTRDVEQAFSTTRPPEP
jgi:putative membrane protein